MLSAYAHDGVVSRLYASAMGDTPWTATLAHIADQFGSSAALVQVSDASYSVLRVENHGYSTEFAERFYASDIYASDPRIPYYRRVRPGTLYFDHALYDVAEMDKHPALPRKLRCAEGEISARRGSPPAERDGRRADDAAERSGGACQRSVHRGVRPAGAAYRAGLRARPCAGTADGDAGDPAGCAGAEGRRCDPSGSGGMPTFMNDAAQALLADGDGLAFRAGTFAASRGPETRRLQAMIRDAIAASAGSRVRPGGQYAGDPAVGKAPRHHPRDSCAAGRAIPLGREHPLRALSS